MLRYSIQRQAGYHVFLLETFFSIEKKTIYDLMIWERRIELGYIALCVLLKATSAVSRLVRDHPTVLLIRVVTCSCDFSFLSRLLPLNTCLFPVFF